MLFRSQFLTSTTSSYTLLSSFFHPLFLSLGEAPLSWAFSSTRIVLRSSLLIVGWRSQQYSRKGLSLPVSFIFEIKPKRRNVRTGAILVVDICGIIRALLRRAGCSYLSSPTLVQWTQYISCFFFIYFCFLFTDCLYGLNKETKWLPIYSNVQI